MSNLVDKTLEQFEQELQVLAAELNNEPGLGTALTYYLLPAGKRIRPRFIFALVADLKLEISPQVFSFAIAIELLHAASLIHDDLPALDDDDFRRGRPSCHKQFGQAKALLAGDYLISRAFLQLAQFENISSLTSLLARAFCDVCIGQSLDVLNWPEIKQIHLLKTCSLFKSCANAVFQISRLPSGFEEDFSNLGESFGSYFQVLDDFKDVFGSSSITGRLESSDLKNNKLTSISSKDLTESEVILKDAHDSLQKLIIELEEKLLLELNQAVELQNLKHLINKVAKGGEVLKLDELRPVEN